MAGGLDLAEGFAGRGDDVYEALIRGHEGLTDEESAAMNARLVLILANQVRDPEAVIAAIRLARETARAG
ncbi:DUF2783 domain-containing protein [Enterovirga aerilata]|uniref:DUF2783 domain-containing protein n=1 Tax=Enterovirga aerilata TaxID=2730920 RepID=A0A849IAY4_9HYPH|nr:DUF2783 domain-containing protein [Enterovirga sp. DB1703]NNM71103.1 DUF2783 domain-containing protein [Enterovirga sp. DB1703]